MRHALSRAWVSVEGFQSGSYSMTRFAPVRLIPRPPTLVVSRNTNMESSYVRERGSIATPTHEVQGASHTHTGSLGQATPTQEVWGQATPKQEVGVQATPTQEVWGQATPTQEVWGARARFYPPTSLNLLTRGCLVATAVPPSMRT